MAKNISNWNLTQADSTAHKMHRAVPTTRVSKAPKHGVKTLAKSATWEDVKRRRAEGDPLMSGGNNNREE